MKTLIFNSIVMGTKAKMVIGGIAILALGVMIYNNSSENSSSSDDSNVTPESKSNKITIRKILKNG